MSDHHEVVRLLQFVERNGYALLFVWVLAEQSAIPLPSAPLLLAAGSLIHAGRLDLATATLCSMTAAMLADTTWFYLGRRSGGRVLRHLCRLSLEPDSCVRRTEDAFLNHGMRSLLVSKFIPGLNTVAAPLAGSSQASYARFALYDAAGVLIWIGAYFGAGYLFSDQLEIAVAYASRLGLNLLLVIAGLFAGWIGWKWQQRRRFLRQLAVARITPAELKERLGSGEELFVVDLRAGIAEERALIPGAVRISPNELAAQATEIPRDREIILFCT